MMNINLYAICLVKNEEDIISLCLTHASHYCRIIYVLDNGSSDRTWERVKALSARNHKIVPFERKSCQFGEGLRGYVFNKIRDRFKPGDWVMILDADEFLEKDPLPYIRTCAVRGVDLIFTLQAQFYITSIDLEHAHIRNGCDTISSFEVLPQYYLINWREPRIFQYNPKLEWPDLDEDGNPTQIHYPRGLKRRSRNTVVNRHYQYRSLPQMQKRLELRSNIFKCTGRFKHNRVKDYLCYIHNHRRLKLAIPGAKIRPTPFDLIRPHLIRRSKWFKRIIESRTLERN